MDVVGDCYMEVCSSVCVRVCLLDSERETMSVEDTKEFGKVLLQTLESIVMIGTQAEYWGASQPGNQEESTNKVESNKNLIYEFLNALSGVEQIKTVAFAGTKSWRGVYLRRDKKT